MVKSAQSQDTKGLSWATGRHRGGLRAAVTNRSLEGLPPEKGGANPIKDPRRLAPSPPVNNHYRVILMATPAEGYLRL